MYKHKTQSLRFTDVKGKNPNNSIPEVIDIPHDTEAGYDTIAGDKKVRIGVRKSRNSNLKFARRPPYINNYVFFLFTLLMGVMASCILFELHSRKFDSHHYRIHCAIPLDYLTSVTPPLFKIHALDSPSWRSYFLPNCIQNPFHYLSINAGYFFENIELDMRNKRNITKIDVSGLADRSPSRIIHDFNVNLTAIVDRIGNRCFVMGLQRKYLAAPKNFLNILRETDDGFEYKNLSLKRVRRIMKIIKAPIKNITVVSEDFGQECKAKNSYVVESYLGGLFERVDAKSIAVSGKFVEFLGKGIIEYDLKNIDEIEEYERQKTGVAIKTSISH